ncbi:MAG: thioredoxin fold domain-containing protein [Burkholderia sp.]|uniref:thioredoxin family protein n=1 Tax=Burkholderia sp. TaxID=36773 RepID=UPI002816BBD1|nr:thioredoxin domain-containing protein [Burkholderia sp.]MDR0245594.1 thioredoxin fold domain-containing protein [Burkholderia sp.]
MTSLVLNTTDDTFEADVLHASRPVVLNFWAPRCVPCHALEPSLERYAKQYDGKVTIARINIAENPQVARQFNIRSVPAAIVFSDGNVHTILNRASSTRIGVVMEALTGSAVTPETERGVPDSAATRVILTFGNDAARKTALLHRVRNTRFDRESSLPSHVIAHDPDCIPVDASDIPAALARNFDTLWKLSSDIETAERAHARIVDLIKAIPVGVDLTTALRSAKLALLYGDDIGLARIAPPGDVSALFARLGAVHHAEFGGQTVDPDVWTKLAREAVSLADRGTAATNDDKIMLMLLNLIELFAMPLDQTNIGHYLVFMPRLAYLTRFSNYLSDSDRMQLEALKQAREQIAEERLGPLPDIADAQPEWRQKRARLRDELSAKDRADYPDLHTRLGAWHYHCTTALWPESLEIVNAIWLREFVKL